MSDGLTAHPFGDCTGLPGRVYGPAMRNILWLIAAALVIFGIVRVVQGAVLVGILLIVAGLLVGPGGVSIFA